MAILTATPISAQADSFAGLIPEILATRLAGHNVFRPIDWVRMSPRQRSRLFGITKLHVGIINKATGVGRS